MAVNPLESVFGLTDTKFSQKVVASITQNMSKQDYEKSVISALNNLLISSKTRLQGLQLLQSLILFCSYDTLSENVLTWASHCMVHHAEDSGREVKLKTLCKILEQTGDMEFFTKKFSSEYLNTTLKVCLSPQNNAEKIAGLKCLKQCMKLYPSWFGNHKQKIEPYLIKGLEASSQTAIDATADAFVSFLETGPAGVNSTNYVTNYSSHFKKLCVSIQVLFNIFFKKFPEVDSYVNQDGEVYTELTAGFTPENLLEVVSNRIINCLIVLKALITKRFSVEKRIVPKDVFDIIYRGLSCHVCLSSSNNRCVFLKKIQTHLFSVFNAFIQGYRTSLLPFAALIENMLLNNLQRPSKCECFVFDRAHKSTTYKTIIKWLKISKVINDSHFQQKIMPIILGDVSPVVKTTFLNVDKSGKKKMKLSENTSCRKAPISDSVIENNCIHALDTLKCILETSFSLDQVSSELIVFIVKTINDIDVAKTLAPYNNDVCQVKLYETFVSFFKVEICKIALPSLHSLINVLNRGVKNRNKKISEVSNEGLQLLEKICQPVCPSLDICDLKSNEGRHFDLLDNILNDSEKQPQKEIKIISNIVISKPFETAEDVEEMEGITEVENVEEIEENTEVEIIDISDNVDKEVVKDNLNVEVEEKFETEILDEAKIVDENTEDKSDACVKDSENNDVEDMACAFIDLVQE